jgi:hypothetical protein
MLTINGADLSGKFYDIETGTTCIASVRGWIE